MLPTVQSQFYPARPQPHTSPEPEHLKADLHSIEHILVFEVSKNTHFSNIQVLISLLSLPDFHSLCELHALPHGKRDKALRLGISLCCSWCCFLLFYIVNLSFLQAKKTQTVAVSSSLTTPSSPTKCEGHQWDGNSNGFIHSLKNSTLDL